MLNRQQDLSDCVYSAIARDALIFGMPSVYIEKQQQILTAVPKPEDTRTPYNQFAHYRHFPDPNNRTVVIWNVDTLCSIAWLDVTNEPIGCRSRLRCSSARRQTTFFSGPNL